MLRLVFLIFLSCFYIQVIAQGVVIPKSADIVVIKGKSYYLHTVQPGQTLYSICKTYGVDVEELKGAALVLAVSCAMCLIRKTIT